MERAESPVGNLILSKNIENKLPTSPKIPRSPNASSYHRSDSRGKYVRDSPNNFRKIAEHRRESPRNAEPVRKNSRDPYNNLRKGSDNFDERRSFEQRAQKLVNSPYRPQNESGDFYKTAPSAQSFRTRDFDPLERELPDDGQNLELIAKHSAGTETGKGRDKPPTGRVNK
jgi:hypothetical protein